MGGQFRSEKNQFFLEKRERERLFSFPLSLELRVTRCSDKKVANILAKIAKFVATENNPIFLTQKYLHQSFYKNFFWRFWAKILSPKGSKNCQNGDKSPNLVTLIELNHRKLENLKLLSINMSHQLKLFLEWQPYHSHEMVFCLFRAIYLGHLSGFSNVRESVIIFLTSLNYVHHAGNVALNMSVAFFDKINLKKIHYICC